MNGSKRGVKKSTTSSAGYDLPKHFGDFRQMMHTFMLNVGVLEIADILRTQQFSVSVNIDKPEIHQLCTIFTRARYE